MADVPVTEVVAVDAALDALEDPTSSEVYSALQPFSNDAAIAAAARRALAGGGGGSQPGVAVWMGPWTYRYFDTIYPSVTADSGTFTFTVNGETTANIAYDADLAAMLAAIIALPGVTAADVGILGAVGNIGFALGFLDEPVTADGGDLVGVGANVSIVYADRIVELFTLAAGDILDNAICQRVTPFDDTGPPRARLIDDPDEDGEAPFWSAPYAGASTEGGGWDLSSEDSFTNLAGTDGNTSGGRPGARQVSYASDVEVADWYVTLPTVAKVETPIHLWIDGGNADGTAGEIAIFVQVSTPVAPA